MLICPFRLPFKASRRLPGGTVRSSSRPAISNCLSFRLATASTAVNRRTRCPAASRSVCLSANETITRPDSNALRYYLSSGTPPDSFVNPTDRNPGLRLQHQADGRIPGTPGIRLRTSRDMDPSNNLRETGATSSALLLWAIVGRVGSWAEAEPFRSRVGVRRMRSPAGTPARSRHPVRNGLAASSGRTRALGSRRSPSARSSARASAAAGP